MNTLDLINALNKILPDNKIIDDALSALRQREINGSFQLRIGQETLSIPNGTPIVIVTKAVYKETLDSSILTNTIGKPTGTYKVLVSVGSIQDWRGGIPAGQYCFAAIYYDDQLALVNVEFYKE